MASSAGCASLGRRAGEAIVGARSQEVVMRHYFSAGLGMLAGIAIGAVAITGLHAQGKPTFYLVTEIDVTNPEAYGKEFAPKAQATIRNSGGRLIAIGGSDGEGGKPITALAGQQPKRGAH